MNGYTVMQSNHIKPEVNYREFRIHKLNTPEFSHVRLLLYWPIFGLLFLFLERLQPQRNYYPVYCGLDDIIPFCEWALIPYLFWFVFNSAVGVLQTLVVALGAGLGIWGAINLLEGYGNDNRAMRS